MQEGKVERIRAVETFFYASGDDEALAVNTQQPVDVSLKNADFVEFIVEVVHFTGQTNKKRNWKSL